METHQPCVVLPRRVGLFREWRNYVRLAGCVGVIGGRMFGGVVGALLATLVGAVFDDTISAPVLWGLVAVGWILGCCLQAALMLDLLPTEVLSILPSHPGWTEPLCHLLPHSLAVAWVNALLEADYHAETPPRDRPWLRPLRDRDTLPICSLASAKDTATGPSWPIKPLEDLVSPHGVLLTGHAGGTVRLHVPVRLPLDRLTRVTYEVDNQVRPLSSIVRGPVFCLGDGIGTEFPGHVLWEESTGRVFITHARSARCFALRSPSHALLYWYLTWWHCRRPSTHGD